MNILNKLTIHNLKLNKKRTIVTIIGIMLSVALIVAVATMFFSVRDSLIRFEVSKKGNYHYMFEDVPPSDLKLFENNRLIETLNYTLDIGYAKIDEIENEYKPYAFLMSFTDNAIDNLTINIVEGRRPKNEEEILIPEHLKTNGHVEYKVGDKITLDVGRRVRYEETEGNGKEEIELNQYNPYSDTLDETIVDTTTKTYTIVGIMKRPSSLIENYSAPGYTFINHLDKDKISGNVDIFARFTKDGLKRQYELLSTLTGVDAKYYEFMLDPTPNFNSDYEKNYSEAVAAISKGKYQVYNTNNYLIQLETNIFGNSETQALGIAAGIVCVIIIFTSVFCIKNSFDISITEKNRQYGMLSSIGATRKQIKKNVLYEAFILGIIGIPLGVILGLFASYILIIISDYLLKGVFEGMKLAYSFSWLALIFSCILGAITIYLSAWRSASHASKISPITAIRGNNDIKIKSKKIKSPKYIKRIFGIGGDISYKNIKRNKKKYRTTVLSIIICSSIFIALSYFINIAFYTVKMEYSSTDYNIKLSYDYNDTKVKDLIPEVLSNSTIKEHSIIKEFSLEVKNPSYSKEILKFYKDYTYEDVYGNTHTAEPPTSINVFAVDNATYKRYLEELNLSYEENKDKVILNNYIREWNTESKEVILPLYTYEKGDTIETSIAYLNPDTNETSYYEASFVVSKNTTERPFGIQNLYNSLAALIVNEDLFNKIYTATKEKLITFNGSENIYFDSSDPDNFASEIDTVLDKYDYNINNINERVKTMNSFYLLVAIFLYGFIIVIALIGITNIFNTITTNMELRKPEFAMLKSIGMTNKEFNHMIRLESLLYGIKSLIIGIPIGLLLSYILYKVLAQDNLSIAFEPPIKAIIITIVVVFLLLISIMKYSLIKINKQNTIETIRNENI